MFTKIKPATDSQLSNDDVANLILSDALTKVEQLTGLNQQASLALLLELIAPAKQTTDVEINKIYQIQQPVLEQNEYQFISGLFN